MEERFEYYWRVYTLAFQLGMKLAVRCEGFRHIIAISAPGCNITYSPFIWLDDRGQASTTASGESHAANSSCQKWLDCRDYFSSSRNGDRAS